MEPSTIRYAQCWEVADVLLEALAVRPQDSCLAIASAGDNALALLARSPRRVFALDYNPAQIACLELRVAAYRALDDEALLRFSGARPAWDRHLLYRLCRPHLSVPARSFWDERQGMIARGYLAAGRLETYFALFRNHVLPQIHSPEIVASLFASKSPDERAAFFDEIWNTPRWRAGFALFFSRPVMQRLGRDPRCFRYARADAAKSLQARLRHAFVDLDPAANPYLHWMLTGLYGSALPFALRPENTRVIRANLDRLSWRACSLETYLAEESGEPIDRFALSDVFEYVDSAAYTELLRNIIARSNRGARLAYWNMFVPRSRPEHLAESLAPDSRLATALHDAVKTFFYSRLVIESVC
jgi:S-adenosylmethionine-diacylglycerol 3-amino-3-carboxypropyl transferase